MNKKGISHIEIMISFTLFISLLAVIFIFIQPVKEPKLNNVALDIVEYGLEKNASISLATLPFKINLSQITQTTQTASTTPINCFTIDNPLNMSELKKENIFVTSSNGLNLAFDVTSNKITLPKREDFYYLHFSFDDTFPNGDYNGEGCPTINPDKVTFSAPRTEALLSFNKLDQLNKTYHNNYEELKKQWFVPEKNNFAITIKGSTNFNMSRKILLGKDIFTRSLTKNMIKGTVVEQVNVNIKVW